MVAEVIFGMQNMGNYISGWSFWLLANFFGGQPLQLPYFFVDGNFFFVFLLKFLGKKGGKWMIDSDRSWDLGKRCGLRPINLLI